MGLFLAFFAVQVLNWVLKRKCPLPSSLARLPTQLKMTRRGKERVLPTPVLASVETQETVKS